jgi:hypothetical protein
MEPGVGLCFGAAFNESGEKGEQNFHWIWEEFSD